MSDTTPGNTGNISDRMARLGSLPTIEDEPLTQALSMADLVQDMPAAADAAPEEAASVAEVPDEVAYDAPAEEDVPDFLANPASQSGAFAAVDAGADALDDPFAVDDASANPYAAPAEPASQPARTPYVRPRKPHRTQEAIDDLGQDDGLSGSAYAHDSNFSKRSITPVTSRGYRRSQRDIARVKKNARYGQYLEIPKGRRSIFQSQERKRRIKSVFAMVFVIALLVGAAYLVWQIFQTI